MYSVQKRPPAPASLLCLCLLVGCAVSDREEDSGAGSLSGDASTPDASPFDAGALTQLDSSVDASEEDAAPDSAGEPSSLTTAQLRFHILSAEVEALDAASIYAEGDLDRFMTHINESFAPAEIRWEVESIQIEAALNEQAYTAAVAAGETGASSLKLNVDAEGMLAPLGWDIFVVRHTYHLGFGGVYVCSVNGDAGMGAIVVPLRDRMDNPQQARKWSHELGHAMGLPHTPCEPEFSNLLMMSGSCEHREDDREDFVAGEITRILHQLAAGGPAHCGSLEGSVVY